MKSPDLNSCFLTGTAGLAGAAGRGATAFGGKVLATGMGLPGGFGGGAFGATSLSAGAIFFLTAAVISKTFQALDTKEPHRPECAPVTVFPAKPRLYRPTQRPNGLGRLGMPRDEAFCAAILAARYSTEIPPPLYHGLARKQSRIAGPTR